VPLADTTQRRRLNLTVHFELSAAKLTRRRSSRSGHTSRCTMLSACQVEVVLHTSVCHAQDLTCDRRDHLAVLHSAMQAGREQRGEEDATSLTVSTMPRTCA
jgi:hypothetical protein